MPVDFDEVLATVAPRPVLVVAPELDRYARVSMTCGARLIGRGGFA